MRRLVLLSLLAVTFLCATSPAHAEGTCQPFSALTQGSIILDPSTLPPVIVEPDFGWGGVAFAMLGKDKSYLGGWFYGKDDETASSIYHRANGKGRNGVYKFAFGTNTSDTPDTFDLQLGEAVWTVDPTAVAYAGNYKASGKLANGTGVFEGASGNLTFHGDFAVWVVDGMLVSVWNGTLEGTLCN